MLIILEKTYYFDTEGFGKKKRRSSMIRLVEKNDVFYNLAKRHNDLYKLQDGLKLIIKNNLGVFTIAGNPISKRIEDFLVSNGVTNLIVEQY